MSVKLRLARRHGSKKRPYYRLVAASSQMPRDGRFLEHVGSYDPLHDPPAVKLNRPRVQYWLDQGALPSNREEAPQHIHRRGRLHRGGARAMRVPVDLPRAGARSRPGAAAADAPAEEAAAADAPAEEAAAADPAEEAAAADAPAEEAAAADAPAEEAAAEEAAAEETQD